MSAGKYLIFLIAVVFSVGINQLRSQNTFYPNNKYIQFLRFANDGVELKLTVKGITCNS